MSRAERATPPVEVKDRLYFDSTRGVFILPIERCIKSQMKYYIFGQKEVDAISLWLKRAEKVRKMATKRRRNDDKKQ